MKVYFVGSENAKFTTLNKYSLPKYAIKSDNSNIAPLEKKEYSKNKESDFYKYAAATAAIATASLGIGYLIKTRNSRGVSNMANQALNQIRTMYKEIISKHPEDEIYYKTLANAIGLKAGEEYKLASIVGKNQLTEILQKASPQDFAIGENLTGVKNRTLRINLHNHTTASDGKLSVEEILEQARKWADEVFRVKGNDGKPPFVFAITDHDTMQGTKEAVRIIAKNPERFKNLKLVLGGEFSVAHTNPTDVHSPLNFELIGYGMNPFNQGLNNFLTKLKTNREVIVKKFIAKVKEKYSQYDLNFEDTKNFHSNLKNMRTNGVLYLTREYLIHKIAFTEYINEINNKILPASAEKLNATKLFRASKDKFYVIKDAKGYKGNEIAEFQRDFILTPLLEQKGYLNDSNRKIYNEIFNKNIEEKKKFINDLLEQWLPKLDDKSGYMVRHEEFFDMIQKTNSDGFFGVAHPGLVNVSMFSKDVEQVCNTHGYNKGEHLAWRLYSALKKSGGERFKATEANYQSYKYKDAGSLHWQKYMGEEKANEFGLLKTGGIDCHKPSIFKKHHTLTESEILENNLKGIVG